MDVSVQPGQDVLDEIVRHRTWRADLFDFERDGIGLEHPNPDGQNGIAVCVFQNHNGSVGDRIHQQAANSHFDFHWGSFMPYITLLSHQLAHKTVGESRSYTHWNIAAGFEVVLRGGSKVQSLVLRGAANPLV